VIFLSPQAVVEIHEFVIDDHELQGMARDKSIDANKRTAFATMDICLVLNGFSMDYNAVEAGSLIVKAAQGIVDELELAEWLRTKSQ
jgi:hypothetical protein